MWKMIRVPTLLGCHKEAEGQLAGMGRGGSCCLRSRALVLKRGGYIKLVRPLGSNALGGSSHVVSLTMSQLKLKTGCVAGDDLVATRAFCHAWQTELESRTYMLF